MVLFKRYILHILMSTCLYMHANYLNILSIFLCQHKTSYKDLFVYLITKIYIIKDELNTL
jgi:hypothetical protein